MSPCLSGDISQANILTTKGFVLLLLDPMPAQIRGQQHGQLQHLPQGLTGTQYSSQLALFFLALLAWPKAVLQATFWALTGVGRDIVKAQGLSGMGTLITLPF